MDNKYLDELSAKEMESILDGATEILHVFNAHFEFETIMKDDLLSKLYLYSITTANVCFAQLKKIYKDNPDSIYSRI